jgi:hypothetical protein
MLDRHLEMEIGQKTQCQTGFSRNSSGVSCTRSIVRYLTNISVSDSDYKEDFEMLFLEIYVRDRISL